MQLIANDPESMVRKKLSTKQVAKQLFDQGIDASIDKIKKAIAANKCTGEEILKNIKELEPFIDAFKNLIQPAKCC